MYMEEKLWKEVYDYESRLIRPLNKQDAESEKTMLNLNQDDWDVPVEMLDKLFIDEKIGKVFRDEI